MESGVFLDISESLRGVVAEETLLGVRKFMGL